MPEAISSMNAARLEPEYRQASPGEDVVVYEGLAQLSFSSGNHESPIVGNLRLKQKWHPMILEWEFSSQKSFPSSNNSQISIETTHFAFKGEKYDFSGTRMSGIVTDVLETPDISAIHFMTFELCNYPAQLGEPAHWNSEDGRSGSSWRRLSLGDQEWQIIIEPLQNFYEAIQSSRQHQKVMLNATGKIERKNKSPFTRVEAVDIIDSVRLYLSFAFSELCPPVLVKGFDKSRLLKWTHLECYDVRGGWYIKGWFDNRPGSSLADAFPDFRALLNDSGWRQAVDLSVSCLIQTAKNPIDPEFALAIAQIPLETMCELLENHSDPEKKNTGTSRAGKDNHICDTKNGSERSRDCSSGAANKISSTLRRCGIPTAPPPEMSKLQLVKQAARKACNIEDLGSDKNNGPEGIVKLRNLIVHPDTDNTKRQNNVAERLEVPISHLYYDAVQLFREYTILLLLWQMGFRGNYSSQVVPRKIPGAPDWFLGSMPAIAIKTI